MSIDSHLRKQYPPLPPNTRQTEFYLFLPTYKYAHVFLNKC